MAGKTLLEYIREKRREIFGCSEISTVQEVLEEIHEIEEKDLPKELLFREEPTIHEKVLEKIKRMEENKEEHFND